VSPLTLVWVVALCAEFDQYLDAQVLVPFDTLRQNWLDYQLISQMHTAVHMHSASQVKGFGYFSPLVMYCNQ